MQKFSRFINLSLLLSLALLPGCWPFEQKEEPDTVPMSKLTPSQKVTDGSEVLLSINGRPVITEKSLQEYIEQAKGANEQVAMILEIMPNAEHDIFFNGLMQDKLLKEWIKDKGIDQRQEYQNDMKQLLQMAHSSLAAQYFQKELNVTVSDSEARKYYDEHKQEIPGVIVSPGGVKARGVVFDDTAKAQAFYAKLQAGANFATTAQEENLTIDDFGGQPINDRSFVDPKVKEAVLAISSYPKAVLVKLDDGKAWVVQALAKEQAEYLPFDQVKEGIKNMLKERKVAEVFEQEIKKLKSKFKVVENKAYFEKKTAAKEASKK